MQSYTKDVVNKCDSNGEFEYQLHGGSKLYPEYAMRTNQETLYQLRTTLGNKASSNHSFTIKPYAYKSTKMIISIDTEQADLGTEDETVTDHGHVLIEPETVLVPETSVDLEPDFEPDPGLRNALELPVRIRLSSTTTTTAKLLPAANNKKRKKLSQSKSGPPGKKNRTKAPSKSVRSQVDEAGDVGAKPETAGPQIRVKMDELRFFYCEGTR